MSKKHFLKRQLLIINKLKSYPSSFAELQKHLQHESQFDEENYELSIRTFQRDIAEIKSLFEIEIKFNRSQGIYEIIDNQNQIHNERLIEAFTILDTLKLAQQFDEEILFEQRKSLGLENIFILLHAIKNSLEVTFSHKKYWDDFQTQRTVKPYVLKEAKNRWYLIGLESKNNQIKSFGLDRISGIDVTKKKFSKPPKAFIQNKLKSSFGVIFEENEPQKVVLQFSSFQANFIKALPLHHSQRVVSENEKETVIELQMYTTYDFIMEILSMGKEVKVIEPLNLKEEIITILKELLNNY